MPTLSGARPDAPEGELIAFTTELPLRGRRHALAFLRSATAVRRLLDEMLADPDSGLVRYELRANPFSNRYATESVWVSDAQLARFSAHPVHVEAMRRHAAHLGAATFERRVVR